MTLVALRAGPCAAVPWDGCGESTASLWQSCSTHNSQVWAHTWDPNAREAEAANCELQGSLGYTVRLSTKQKET